MSLKQLRSLWDKTMTKPWAEPQGKNRPFFGGVIFFFFLHRPQSTAIYFNDGNEQCSCVGLLRRSLILPWGNVKHCGWPPQPALWKRQFAFFKSSFVYFCTSMEKLLITGEKNISPWTEKKMPVDAQTLHFLFGCCQVKKEAGWKLILSCFASNYLKQSTYCSLFSFKLLCLW